MSRLRSATTSHFITMVSSTVSVTSLGPSMMVVMLLISSFPAALSSPLILLARHSYLDTDSQYGEVGEGGEVIIPDTKAE